MKKEIIDMKGRLRITVYNNQLVDGVYIRIGINRRTGWNNNMIVTTGKTSILDRLVNTGNTNEGLITYGAVGLDGGAVSVGNEQLGSELARKPVTISTRAAQVATIRTYFAPTEATGSLNEFGWFGGGVNGDAGIAANSGTMFNRVVFALPEIITDSQSFSVEQEFIF